MDNWFSRVEPPPDVFAVVMATGIVSVAAAEHRYWRIAELLTITAFATFAILGLGFAARAVTQPLRVLRLTRDPDVALRMFTFVAACLVLIERANSRPTIAWCAGVLGLAGWAVLVPLACVDVASRPAMQLRAQAHGAWLLPSVATQALARVAADLAGPAHARWLVTTAVAAWLLGLLIYLAVSWLIGCRALAAPFTPEVVTPDSWILMGALAIGALAGDHIVAAARLAAISAHVVTGARIGTFALWVAASLWIPILLYAEVWQADRVVGSLHYQGVWWSAVFPIGMYSATCWSTATTLDIPALKTTSLVFFWIAFAMWTLVALGSLHTAATRMNHTAHNPR